MPVIDVDQRSPEWFAARKGRITASLAAAVLGIDPYRGPLSAFNEITGRTGKSEANAFQVWGAEGEAAARGAYEEETGYLAFTTGLWVHPELPWLAASPDGLVGDDGLLEVKCPKTALPPAMPDHHRVQVAVQLACTGREWCDYFAWHPRDGHYLSRLTRDEAGIPLLLARLNEFYQTYVLPDVAPPRRRAKQKEAV